MMRALVLNSKGYHTIYFLEELQKLIKGFDRKEQIEKAISEFEEAISLLEKIEADDEDNMIIAYALYNKGYAISRLSVNIEHFKMALECFEKAIDRNHKYAEAWLMKGMLIYKQSKNVEGYENALNCLDEAIKYFNARSTH